MLADMAMMTQYANMDSTELNYALTVLMEDIVHLACLATIAEKRGLHGFVLEHSATGEENELYERQWLKALAHTAQKPLTAGFIEALLMMSKHTRTKQLESADTVLRLKQIQMRLNSSIESKDIESAQRLIRSYLKPLESGVYAA